MNTAKYQVELHINKIAGGFPSSEDAVRTFMQSPEMKLGTPQAIRDEFLGGAERMESLLATITTSPSEGDEDGESRQAGWVYSGFRKDENGNPILGAHQIKAMLQGAAASIYDTTGKPSLTTYKKAIMGGLSIAPEHILMNTTRPLTTERFQQIVERTWPTSRIPSNRVRQIAHEVDIAFSVIVLDTEKGPARVLKEDTLKDLFDTGGTFVGLGTDRGYGFGRFEITRFERVP